MTKYSARIKQKLSKAVKLFWLTRESQEKKQGSASGKRDYGGRSSVTGGAQCDGFAELLKELVVESGLENAEHTLKGGDFTRLFSSN